MGKLIRNGVPYTDAPGLADSMISTSTTAALTAKQGNLLAKSIGQIESTDIAVYAHAKDSYFMWKGQYVRATALIGAGGSISSSNTTVTSVSDELKNALDAFRALGIAENTSF